MIFESGSVEETRALGARIALESGPGDVLALRGELGAGKTEFVRGFVAALSPAAAVRSPTFTLVNTYDTPAFPVHHFDFYRLTNSAELIHTGFFDYIGANGVCLVEWADLFPEVLPEGARCIRFEDEGEQRRRVRIDE